MINHGDITKLDGAQLPPVDIIAGDSPCQDLSSIRFVNKSVEDLDGSKSRLFFDMVRVIREMRIENVGKPRFVIMENVPNILCSNGGKDFHRVVSELIGVVDCETALPEPPEDGFFTAGVAVSPDSQFSLAWRTVDSLGWGMAQKRERVIILVDYESPNAHIPLARFVPMESGSHAQVLTHDIFGKLEWGIHWIKGGEFGTGKHSIDRMSAISGTLELETIVSPKYDVTPKQAVAMLKSGDFSNGDDDKTAFFKKVLDGIVAGNDVVQHEKVSMPNTTCVWRTKLDRGWNFTPYCNTVRCSPCNTGTKTALVMTRTPFRFANQTASTVRLRRFTPMEVERLFGYPDNWTKYDQHGNTIADYNRYHMLGNTIALPPFIWLLQRLSPLAPQGTTFTLGSLFDGIGGFPLCASASGITPLWSSEIEKWACEVTAHQFAMPLQLTQQAKENTV